MQQCLSTVKVEVRGVCALEHTLILNQERMKKNPTMHGVQFNSRNHKPHFQAIGVWRIGTEDWNLAWNLVAFSDWPGNQETQWRLAEDVYKISCVLCWSHKSSASTPCLHSTGTSYVFAPLPTHAHIQRVDPWYENSKGLL